MLLLKELIVLSAILILASAGLLEIFNQDSFPPAQNQPGTIQEKTFSAGDDKKEFSDEFLYFQNLIQNKSINKEKIQSELKSLKSDFERVYLSALLKKRNGNFEASFNQLFSLLNQFPPHLIYYEELSNLGKVSGNLKKLSQWIDEKKDSTNDFYLYFVGMVEYQKGNASEAINKFKTLVSKEFISKNIFYQLAYAFRIVGNYDESFRFLLEAEKLCSEDDSYRPTIINLKGTLFFLSGEYERAKKEYESSLQLSKNNGDRVEEIKAVANLAIIKDQYGEVVDARDDFTKTIKMSKEIENKELLAFLYSELGVSFTYTNNLVEARENYEKSFSLYELMKNDERLSYLSSNIGSLYLQISNYKSALDYYNRGLKYSGENKLGQILNLTGLADVYSNESNYSKALQYYNRAKEIADSIKDVSSALKIDQGIGALYFNINRPLNSLEILQKAESGVTEAEIPFELVKLYSKIGTVLTSIDSFKQAETYFLKGLNISEQTGDIYNSIVLKTELAHNYFKLGKYSEASNFLTAAQKAAKEYDLTQVLGLQDLYWGKIYESQNEKEKSNEKFLSAFQLSGRVNDFNTQIEAGYLLAQDFEKNSKLNKAENWYLTTINLIEKISSPLTLNQEIQIAHFSGLNNVYNSLTELYLQQGKGEEAFLVIEKSRSRNTRINLDKLKLFTQLKDENEYHRFIDLEWMISSGLYDQTVTDSLEKIYTGIKNELIRKNKGVNEILDRKYSFNLKDLEEKLGDEEYLFSVYTGEKFITLFNLNSKGLNFETLYINRDSLLSMLGSISPIYKSGLESEEIYVNEDLFSFNALAAFRMYETVFKDFLSPIPKESTVIVSFPPELVKLPLELLVTEWDEGESPYYYGDKEFLINKYQILYTPSASVYFIQKDKPQENNKQNLLVGDPFINNSEFALSVRGGLIDVNPSQARDIRLFPLEHSFEEIKSIEATLTNNMVFLSKEATESNFKENAPASNIVHISSHSFLLKDQPLVLFSPQEDLKDDGFLELGEIVQLNLNSELVVLSSCRSGLGKIDEAEGIIGMQKAFFEAGSKSVLVTLWDVNDKYTSYFMRDFYKYLAEGKSKSEALRQAKLNFIKNYSANPYYWSAFILSGNPSGIKLQEAASFTLLHVLGILLLIGFVYFIAKKRLKKLSF
jgi:tetratricopeptide (TPR) repeat protein